MFFLFNLYSLFWAVMNNALLFDIKKSVAAMQRIFVLIYTVFSFVLVVLFKEVTDGVCLYSTQIFVRVKLG